LHRLAGIRPCLYPPLSIERGIPYGMEGDLTATVGLLAAMRASGAPGMFTEVFTFDPQENLLLMGHAGVHDPRLAAEDGITLVPDMEYRFSDRCEGAWMEFVLAAGAVTCVSFYDTGHACRMTVFEGDSLGAPRRLEGFAHALIRPVLHVRQLLPRLVQLGLTQHFAIVPGRCSSTLARWCALSGIEFCLVQPGNGELPVDHR
jgi:L-arabinose isomerase